MANTINRTLLYKQVTPDGKARYAKLGKVIDEYEDKKRYVINVVFGKGTPAEKQMKERCDHYLELAKQDDAFKGKKWNPMCNHGYEELDDGTLSFRFRTNAEFTDKFTGEKQIKHIFLADEYGRKIDPMETEVGNGSVVQVGYDVGAYYGSSAIHGINLYLKGVMVKQLVQNDDDDCGFTFKKLDAKDVFDVGEQVEAPSAEESKKDNVVDDEPSVDDDPFA